MGNYKKFGYHMNGGHDKGCDLCAMTRDGRENFDGIGFSHILEQVGYQDHCHMVFVPCGFSYASPYLECHVPRHRVVSCLELKVISPHRVLCLPLIELMRSHHRCKGCDFTRD